MCPLAVASEAGNEPGGALSPLSPVEQSRFERTALGLRDADPEWRAEFATTALDELAQAYAAEAALARGEAIPEVDGGENGGPVDTRLLGWSRAVERYAAQLGLVREDIALGFPVALDVLQERTLAITVAERRVILSHPRPDHQALLEQAVLERFCRGNLCEQLTARTDGPEPIPMSSATVRPAWTFTGDGALCSHRGVHLRFSAGAALPVARTTCQQLLVELALLDRELAWQRRHGVIVNWDALAVTATPGRTGHQVRLNDAGDTVLVTLPLLYSSAALLDQVRPWLRARAAGDRDATLELEAAALGWESGYTRDRTSL